MIKDLSSFCDIVRVKMENSELILGIAELYCEIFREPPCNEIHWTITGVSGDLSGQLSLPGAICLAVIYDKRIIGFTWGYGADRSEMAKIAGADLFGGILPNGNRLFYIDELGVCPRNRHCHIGLEISHRCLKEARTEGFKTFCLRTDKSAVPAINLYRKLGFTDTGIIDLNHSARTYWYLAG